MLTNISSAEVSDQLDGLEQDCSISTANTLEVLQSCTNPLICRRSVGNRCVDTGMALQGIVRF